MHQIADLMELLLTHRLIIDDEGIIEVASLDQVVGKECLYFTDEDEGTARSDLRIKVLEVLEGCELVVQHGRVEGDVHIDTELIVWQEDDA